MELNKIYNESCFDTFKRLDNESIDLCIIDPPYFNIKGDFDFQMSFEEWQQLHHDLASELKRTLKETGTVFLFGHWSRIAYQQIIFDQYFKLENNLVWEKIGGCSTKTGARNFRKFAPVTERILFYSKEINVGRMTSIRYILENDSCFVELKKYFYDLNNIIKIKGFRNIYKILGHRGTQHCFSKTQWEMPTEKTYNELIQHFNIDVWDGFRTYESLREEYESLREEYESLRRYFDNKNGLYDVLHFDQEAHITKKYKHPTQKPPKLINELIQCTTKENDFIFVPFVGSGVDCEQATLLNRNYIGSEINEEYCEIAINRIKQHTNQLKLII